MHKREATPEEVEDCKKIYSDVLEVVDGKDYDSILNTLCFVLGELGIDLDVSKQEFIAIAVEQISSAYDLHHLANAKPQGEA